MKRLIHILVLVLIIVSSCKKNKDQVAHINCDGLITDTLGTNDNGRIYMQNAFTPNGDGLNDISRPITKNISSLVYTIYDGDNNVVFTTNTLLAGWSTTVGSNKFETYYYKIQAITSSGRHIGMCGELYKLSCFPASIPKSSLFFEDRLLLNGTYSATTLETLPACP
jgi:CHU_C Type IX secretion signal domain